MGKPYSGLRKCYGCGDRLPVESLVGVCGMLLCTACEGLYHEQQTVIKALHRPPPEGRSPPAILTRRLALPAFLKRDKRYYR